MKCPKCEFENPEDTHFCGNCATPLRLSEKTPSSLTKTIQAPSADLSKGSKIAGKYKIIEGIGRGGMGIVYKAEDPQGSRKTPQD